MAERITRQQLEMKVAWLAEMLGYATTLEMDAETPALLLNRHQADKGEPVFWSVELEAIGAHRMQRDIFGSAWLTTNEMWRALCYACDAVHVAQENAKRNQ